MTALASAASSTALGDTQARYGLAPDFELRSTDGQLVRLSDYLGRRLVVLSFSRGLL